MNENKQNCVKYRDLAPHCIWQSQSSRAVDRTRSLSTGNGPRPEHLGAANLSGSETSILSQAMVRAKQLEEEEKAERLGETFCCFMF